MRSFVALAPEPGARESLAAQVERCAAHYPGARRMRAANLHLTLAFIGEIDAVQADQVARALAALPAPDFELAIDRIGEFGRVRVLWAGGPDNPALDRLAATVREQLNALGVNCDRRAFVPHISLLRDLPPGPAAAMPEFAAISWRPERPQLFVSTHDARGVLHYTPWPAPAA